MQFLQISFYVVILVKKKHNLSTYGISDVSQFQPAVIIQCCLSNSNHKLELRASTYIFKMRRVYQKELILVKIVIVCIIFIFRVCVLVTSVHHIVH